MESYVLEEMIRRVEDPHLTPRYANPPVVAEETGQQLQQPTGTEIPRTALAARLAAASPRRDQS
jgi:hypothetical protein